MKRAKQPPPPELRNECSVIADMLDLGRRREIIECPSLGIGDAFKGLVPPASHDVFNPERMADWILGCLTRRAMSEYLRRFPKARKPNDDPWIAMPTIEIVEYKRDHAAALKKIPGLTVKTATETFKQERSTGETDYQCLFCRKSLYTRPTQKRLKRGGKIHKDMLRHIEVCAVRLLAGLLDPHPPLRNGQHGL